MDLPTVERVPCWLYFTSHSRAKEDTLTELQSEERAKLRGKLSLVGCQCCCYNRVMFKFP